ncbi:MAG TPA: acyl-ACP desaturase [Fimbriimonadaceae bacterium]|nr:acyl-ACP desaturase [Fimbriimonadaceae bacterium]
MHDSLPITRPEDDIVSEIESQRPRVPVGLVTHEERHRLVEQGFVGLYRWYVKRSQETRNWNPDSSFDWRNYRKDHSPEVSRIIEGFFAVEQYVPDYVTSLLKIVRTSHGRSHFQLRWGSEEEKHADLWHNAVFFGQQRSPEWLDAYMGTLREKEWKLPWEDPLHMLFYTVFQERATQVNYLNLGLVAKGVHTHEAFRNDKDPVLAEACRIIAVDEAAHYNFFLEGARLYLYYFPEKAMEAMVNVLRHFAMPAGDLIPNYNKLAELLHRTTIFGAREHARDVVKVALQQLGAKALRAVEDGLRRSREVPDSDTGAMRRTAIFDSIDFGLVETKVKALFRKIGDFEREHGFADIRATLFRPNPDFLIPDPA